MHLLDYRFKFVALYTVTHMLKLKPNAYTTLGISLVYKSRNFMLYKQNADQRALHMSFSLV